MSHDMSIQFGQEVPLYSKPPNWPASPPPAAQAFVRPQSTFQAHNPIHGCAKPLLRHPSLHVLGSAGPAVHAGHRRICPPRSPMRASKKCFQASMNSRLNDCALPCACHTYPLRHFTLF